MRSISDFRANDSVKRENMPNLIQIVIFKEVPHSISPFEYNKNRETYFVLWNIMIIAEIS